MSKSSLEEMYGQDILLSDMRPYSDAACAANGEVVLSDGLKTVNQDIALRLFIPLGGLFYDRRFGSLIHEYVRDENTLSNRLALCAEVVRRVNMDPRVEIDSAVCRVAQWDELGVQLELEFTLIGSQIKRNLLIDINRSDLSGVIKDAYPAD